MLATTGLVASENPVVLTKEPFPPCPTAGKNSEGVESISEPMGFQHGSRRFQLAPLRKRQSAQQMVTANGDVALGEPLQKNLRSVGLLIEDGSRGCKQQDVAIARLCAHRLFSLRQKLRLSIRIAEGGE